MNSKSMMKTLLLITAFSLAVSACNKDDENSPTQPSNIYSVDATNTKITSALFRYPSSKVVLAYGSVYKSELIFLSAGLTNDGTNLQGKGDMLDFGLYTPNQSLDEGTYTYDPDIKTANTFNDARILYNYDASLDGDDSELALTTGTTLIITKSGTTYTVKVDGKVGDKVVKATYVGVITTGLY